MQLLAGWCWCTHTCRYVPMWYAAGVPSSPIGTSLATFPAWATWELGVSSGVRFSCSSLLSLDRATACTCPLLVKLDSRPFRTFGATRIRHVYTALDPSIGGDFLIADSFFEFSQWRSVFLVFIECTVCDRRCGHR